MLVCKLQGWVARTFEWQCQSRILLFVVLGIYNFDQKFEMFCNNLHFQFMKELLFLFTKVAFKSFLDCFKNVNYFQNMYCVTCNNYLFFKSSFKFSEIYPIPKTPLCQESYTSLKHANTYLPCRSIKGWYILEVALQSLYFKNFANYFWNFCSIVLFYIWQQGCFH